MNEGHSAMHCTCLDAVALYGTPLRAVWLLDVKAKLENVSFVFIQALCNLYGLIK